MSDNITVLETKKNIETRFKLSTYLFLLGELIIFGGIFLAYSIYRFQNPNQFHLAGMEMNTGIGTLNTIILLTSSLTTALFIAALQKGNKFLSQILLYLTIVFALLFIFNKYFEWSVISSLGFYPGSGILLMRDKGQVLFFGIYHLMSGLHILHLLIGIVVLCFLSIKLNNKKNTNDIFHRLENCGLYWHFVVLIWVFFFPLFYLI